jgi:hypothetical protein
VRVLGFPRYEHPVDPVEVGEHDEFSEAGSG